MLYPKEAMRTFSQKTFDEKYKQSRWVTYDEASLLREWVRAANPDVVLESGTANGYSALWLASGMEKGKLYTFDPVDRPKVWTEFTTPEVTSKINFCQAEFRHMSRFASIPPNARIVTFIDGDHGYTSVMEDWHTLKPYLKPGDVVLFHDLRESKVIKAWDDIARETPNSRSWRFRTPRVIGVLLYETQTLPVCDESKEPLVIHIPNEIKGPEKIRDTEFANDEKPWTAYDTKALHTSVECHLLYRTAKRLGKGNYANLGTYKGMSSACLSFGAGLDSTIYCVDDYELETIKGIYPQKMIDKFKELGLPEPRICKGKTTHFPETLKSVPFKFVFIDAGHRYNDIKDDFEMWAPLVSLDGEIGIHDCEYSNIHKYIEESVLPKWKLVEHVWRTKIFKRT